MSHKNVWLVTGASSGFGLEMTRAALKNGDKVVATLRKPDALLELQSTYSSEQLLVVKLDVTNPNEIEVAFAKAKETFGRVDVVFNNAGFAAVGEIEGTPDEVARSIFEVVFFGAANVSKTALKYFRENHPVGGILLQVSSNFGIEGAPGAGYYSAAKAALEGFSESLSKEIDPAWNIKVTLIEPGPFKTKGVQENNTVLPQHPAYTNENLPTNIFRKMFSDGFAADGDSAKAATTFLKLVALGDDIPFRFPIHRDAALYSRRKAKDLNDAAEKWESWSEDVYL